MLIDRYEREDVFAQVPELEQKSTLSSRYWMDCSTMITSIGRYAVISASALNTRWCVGVTRLQ